MKCFLLVIITTLLPILCYGESQAIKVAFLNPDTKGNPFWDLVTSFMQASALDLGMDLTVVYSQRGDRFEHLKLAKSILNHKDKPDYFISIIKVGSSDKVIGLAEKNKVNYFSINTHVLAESNSLIKNPREMSRYWLGQMIPNDVQAGQRLASMLIEKARSKNLIDKQIHIIGLGGARDSSATFDRISGLKKALLNEPTAALYQVVNTDWSQENAKLKVSGLLKRYKDVNLIWCASDTIGLGAIDALNELGMPAGKKVLVGGIDWSSDGLNAIASRDLTTSLGGHFMEGGLALVLLYDHYHQKDFVEELGVTIKTDFHPISFKDKALIKKINHRDWKTINFKKLSKVHTPNTKKYNFSLNNIISQPVPP